MNMHSADAETAEEAIAFQEKLDSNMATSMAMEETLLSPRFYTTDFAEMDAINVEPVRNCSVYDEWWNRATLGSIG